jgi:CRP-like cAMP-binding protein
MPLSSHELTTALKQSHLFSCLTRQQLERVISASKTIELDEGQQLFSQGDRLTCFYLVQRGAVKLFRLSAEGQEKVIEIVQRGHTFAEAMMFMQRPDYPVSCAALQRTVLIGIDAHDFKAMLSSSVDTCLLLLGDMSLRLHKLVNEIGTLTLDSGTCRVANYLLQQLPDEQDSFDLDIAKGVIAARLSIKPETFSRIIRNLREKGILSIDGHTITVHDRRALEAVSLQ